jgi:hypothetical protein
VSSDPAAEKAPEEGKRTERPSRSRLRVGAAIGTVATIVGIATGVLTLRTQIFGGPSGSSNTATDSAPREVPQYQGIAGHFAAGQRLLAFLNQNDGQSVHLHVAFPDLATGPGGGPNVYTRSEPFQGGTISHITEVDLMTTCSGDISATNTDPTPADGCMGTGLAITGPETTDTQTYFDNGVPVLDGYFAVDVTGDLHQGITAIDLRPLTAKQAKQNY